jgi:hypothetical protein
MKAECRSEEWGVVSGQRAQAKALPRRRLVRSSRFGAAGSSHGGRNGGQKAVIASDFGAKEVRKSENSHFPRILAFWPFFRWNLLPCNSFRLKQTGGFLGFPEKFSGGGIRGGGGPDLNLNRNRNPSPSHWVAVSRSDLENNWGLNVRLNSK